MRGHRTVLLAFFASLSLLEGPGAAQAPAGSASPPAVRTIHLRDFLAEVERSNLDLAASRFNLPVAEAQVALARLFPDPQLTAGIDALDLTDRKAPTATVYGLSQTIELGGKRGARIAEAKAGKTLAEAQLDDFFQSLRASAANAFIDAMAARRVLTLKRRTLEGVEKLVTATEHRLRVGDVGASALWQVNVEAERFRSEVLKAEGTWPSGSSSAPATPARRPASSPMESSRSSLARSTPRCSSARRSSAGPTSSSDSVPPTSPGPMSASPSRIAG